jgi:hypothetical protein
MRQSKISTDLGNNVEFCPGFRAKKTRPWLSERRSDLASISFKRKEKNQRDNMKRRKEEEEWTNNQQTAQNEGFCCHHHEKRLKMKDEDEEERNCTKRSKVDGPDHCIHCDEDPCVFVQIESRLCENDTIYITTGTTLRMFW